MGIWRSTKAFSPFVHFVIYKIYLKVHEGPTLIRMANKEPSKLKAGIFFSDEPGFYKEGEFGLRLETILRVVSEDDNGSEFGNFISFRPVTLVPFEPKLIR